MVPSMELLIAVALLLAIQCEAFHGKQLYFSNSIVKSKNVYTTRVMRMSADEKNMLPISVVSSVGALEMAYLTYNKLMDTPNFCLSHANCAAVLSGPFSTIPLTDIPLSLLGLLAYGAIFAMSSSNITNAEMSSRRDLGVLVLSSSMATFSLYLMTVLHGVLHATCPYCYLSAGLSLGLAVIAWGKRIVSNRTTAVIVSTSSCAVTAMASALLFYMTVTLTVPDSASASTAPAYQYLAAEAAKNQPKVSPPITKSSSEKSVELAKRIEKLGGKMYGAYWCSHCFNQKQEFGIEAFKRIEYLECDREGVDSKHTLCRQRMIIGYPTWELAGKFYPGEKSLQELEDLVAKVEKETKTKLDVM